MMNPNEMIRKGLSRRRFLKNVSVGSLGLAALATSPEAMARALAQGTTAADVQGAGVPKGIVRLNFNENPLGPSPKAMEAIIEHLPQMNRYGSNTSQLFMRLNQLAGVNFDDLDMQKREDQDKIWKRNRIYLSDGSENLLRAASFTYLREGGEIVEAEPGYSSVSEYGEFMSTRLNLDVKVNRVPLTSDMRHDLDAMKNAVNDRTRLVVITNPNNPTGTIVPYNDLEQFVSSMPDHVTVLIDEAYIDFIRDETYKSMANVAISRPNVLVTRTFSKVYGLPGLRVGYAVAMPDTLENYWVHTSFPSPIAIHAATAAVNDTAHIQATKEVTREGKIQLAKAFDEMGLPYTMSDSNFMIVNVKDSKAVMEKLAKQKVYVRDADRNWGVKGHIRVSIGTKKENEAFLNALGGGNT